MHSLAMVLITTNVMGKCCNLLISKFSILGFSAIYLLVLVGVELPLCVAVAPSKNGMTCFLE